MASYNKLIFQQWGGLIDEEKRKHAYFLVDELRTVFKDSISWKDILKNLARNYNSVNGWQHLLTDDEFEFIRNIFLSQARDAHVSLDRFKNPRKPRKKRRRYQDSEEIAMSENIACDAELELVHFEEQHRQVPLLAEEIALGELWWPPIE
jgi:hypothetical protein